MEEQKRACWNCDHYRAYYTKGFYHFDKRDKGLCTRTKQTIEDKHFVCNNWCSNHIIRKIRKTVVLKALEQTLATLADLQQMIQEEYDENKINLLK